MEIPKGFFSLLGALILTTVAFKFFPDPYSYNVLKEQGLSKAEIRRLFITYSVIGIVILFVTTILFFKVIKSNKL